MPQGGLISLTFDDALEEHLDRVIPLLAKCGLRGTFYTHVTAPPFLRRLNEWVSAARDGHELGNHTIFHPATERKSWVRPGSAIENYSLDRMKLEIDTANRLLQAIDGSAGRTFAYPCSATIAGRYGWPNRFLHRVGLEKTRWPGLVERAGLDWRTTRCSYVKVLEDLVPAARGGGLVIDDAAPPLKTIDRYSIPSAAVDGHSFGEMRDFVERGLAAESWPVLQFHGVGGGHRLDCRYEDFAALIDWLAERHRDSVVTVLQGARMLWPRETALVCGDMSVHA